MSGGKVCIGCERPKGQGHEHWCPVVTGTLSSLPGKVTELDGNDALSRLNQAEHRIRELGGRAAKDGALASILSALRDELTSLGEYQAAADALDHALRAISKLTAELAEAKARIDDLQRQLTRQRRETDMVLADLDRSGASNQKLRAENTRLNSELNQRVLAGPSVVQGTGGASS